MSAVVRKSKKRVPPFSIRLTEDERAKLAQAAGGMALAAYVKSVVLSEDAPKYRASRKPPVNDQILLAQILARLGQIGSGQCLRALAEAAEDGVLPVDESVTADLNQACVDVAWMRVTLMRALGLKPDV